MASRYGLEIRAANAGDAPGLAELLAAAGLSASAAEIAERLAAMRAEPGVVLLAVEWGPPSGVIALHWRQTLSERFRTADVSLLLVGPDDRRRGVARLLLKAGAQAARTAGCGALRLAIAEHALALRGFAEATGFEAAGRSFIRPLRKRS